MNLNCWQKLRGCKPVLNSLPTIQCDLQEHPVINSINFAVTRDDCNPGEDTPNDASESSPTPHTNHSPYISLSRQVLQILLSSFEMGTEVLERVYIGYALHPIYLNFNKICLKQKCWRNASIFMIIASIEYIVWVTDQINELRPSF